MVETTEFSFYHVLVEKVKLAIYVLSFTWRVIGEKKFSVMRDLIQNSAWCVPISPECKHPTLFMIKMVKTTEKSCPLWGRTNLCSLYPREYPAPLVRDNVLPEIGRCPLTTKFEMSFSKVDFERYSQAVRVLRTVLGETQLTFKAKLCLLPSPPVPTKGLVPASRPATCSLVHVYQPSWISLIYVFTPERNISRKTLQTFYKRTSLFMICCVNDCIFLSSATYTSSVQGDLKRFFYSFAFIGNDVSFLSGFLYSATTWQRIKNCKILPHICHKKVIVQIIMINMLTVIFFGYIEVHVICIHGAFM